MSRWDGGQRGVFLDELDAGSRRLAENGEPPIACRPGTMECSWSLLGDAPAQRGRPASNKKKPLGASGIACSTAPAPISPPRKVACIDSSTGGRRAAAIHGETVNPKMYSPRINTTASSSGVPLQRTSTLDRAPSHRKRRPQRGDSPATRSQPRPSRAAPRRRMAVRPGFQRVAPRSGRARR